MSSNLGCKEDFITEMLVPKPSPKTSSANLETEAELKADVSLQFQKSMTIHKPTLLCGASRNSGTISTWEINLCCQVAHCCSEWGRPNVIKLYSR
jgi:hypothetical protein